MTMTTNQPLESTMFCPKCGAEALAEQRFCKHCGTNLELINDALKGGDNAQNPYKIAVEALKRNAVEFARSWKDGWGEIASEARRRHPAHEIRRQIRDDRIRRREEIRARNWPRPKEWLSYSWQHNLRNGLLSLFG